jgi:hypothetical protein
MAPWLGGGKMTVWSWRLAGPEPITGAATVKAAAASPLPSRGSARSLTA